MGSRWTHEGFRKSSICRAGQCSSSAHEGVPDFFSTCFNWQWKRNWSTLNVADRRVSGRVQLLLSFTGPLYPNIFYWLFHRRIHPINSGHIQSTSSPGERWQLNVTSVCKILMTLPFPHIDLCRDTEQQQKHKMLWPFFVLNHEKALNAHCHKWERRDCCDDISIHERREVCKADGNMIMTLVCCCGSYWWMQFSKRAFQNIARLSSDSLPGRFLLLRPLSPPPPTPPFFRNWLYQTCPWKPHVLLQASLSGLWSW